MTPNHCIYHIEDNVYLQLSTLEFFTVFTSSSSCSAASNWQPGHHVVYLICTCDTMQDLPLRSVYEQTIRKEKLGTNPSIIFHTYIIIPHLALQ